MIATAEPRGLASDGAGLTRAFDGAPVAVALFDRELRLVRANGRFRTLTGCPGGMPSLLALHEIFPTALVAVGPALVAARRGEPFPPLPVRFPRPGGDGATAEVTIAWLPDALERGGEREDGLLFVAAELDAPLAAHGVGVRDGGVRDAEVRRAVPPLADAPAGPGAPRVNRLPRAVELPGGGAAAGPRPSRDAGVAGAPVLPRRLSHDLANVLDLVGNAAQLLLLRADEPDAVRTYAARIAGAVERAAALLDAGAGGEGGEVVAASPSPAHSSAGAPPHGARAGRSVLVVEDDESSRDIITTVLARAGHRVQAVAGVAEAIALLEAGGADDRAAPPVEVVVTDVGLGDGNGWELAAMVRERWPGILVGVVTGWDASTDPGVRTDFVLRKPIRLPELVACVAGERR